MRLCLSCVLLSCVVSKLGTEDYEEWRWVCGGTEVSHQGAIHTHTHTLFLHLRSLYFTHLQCLITTEQNFSADNGCSVFHSSHCWTLISAAMAVPFYRFFSKLLKQHDKDSETLARDVRNATGTDRWMQQQYVCRIPKIITHVKFKTIAELFNMPAISQCVASATLAVEVKVSLTVRVKGHGPRPRLLSQTLAIVLDAIISRRRCSLPPFKLTGQTNVSLPAPVESYCG